jgi:hypothetical protein
MCLLLCCFHDLLYPLCLSDVGRRELLPIMMEKISSCRHRYKLAKQRLVDVPAVHPGALHMDMARYYDEAIIRSEFTSFASMVAPRSVSAPFPNSAVRIRAIYCFFAISHPNFQISRRESPCPPHLRLIHFVLDFSFDTSVQQICSLPLVSVCV